MIVNKFLENLNKNPNKTAFIDYDKGKLRYKSFQDVYLDMLKVISYLSENNVKKQSKLLIFLKPSYEFYLILLAGIFAHYQMIVIESFTDSDKVTKMIELSQPDYIIVNSKTKIFKYFFKPLKYIKSLNINNYQKRSVVKRDADYNLIDPVLLTFTSGSTGYPKLIKRTIKDLDNQYQFIIKTIDNVDENDIVLALNPIYVLANLVFGITSIIFSKDLRKRHNVNLLEKILKETNANTINASISKYILFNKVLPSIEKAYSGGSLISLQDAYKIKKLLPNAHFTYIYGASEVILMSKTSIDDYISNLLEGKICIGEVVTGVQLKIDNIDSHGVGEIIANGNVVLSNNSNDHHTGDLGYIKDNKVYLKGRKNISSPQYYNYDIEMMVLNKFKDIKKVCFLIKNNIAYLVYEADFNLTREITDYLNFDCKIIKVKKLPTDIRHHYKIDISKVMVIIDKYNSIN